MCPLMEPLGLSTQQNKLTKKPKVVIHTLGLSILFDKTEDVLYTNNALFTLMINFFTAAGVSLTATRGR